MLDLEEFGNHFYKVFSKFVEENWGDLGNEENRELAITDFDIEYFSDFLNRKAKLNTIKNEDLIYFNNLGGSWKDGAEKIVFVSERLEYVIKIPLTINGIYDEPYIYQKAKQFGLDFFFTKIIDEKTIPLSTIFSTVTGLPELRLYRQEKVDRTLSFDDCKTSVMNFPKELQESFSTVEPIFLSETFRRRTYSKKDTLAALKRLDSFLGGYKINDINYWNMGIVKDKITIFDFSGFSGII